MNEANTIEELKDLLIKGDGMIVITRDLEKNSTRLGKIEKITNKESIQKLEE